MVQRAFICLFVCECTVRVRLPFTIYTPKLAPNVVSEYEEKTE